MKTFWQRTHRVIYGCMSLFFFYLFFVHPHLGSATPFRDIAHGILIFLLTVALTMTLVIWLTRKLWRHYEAQSLPPMPEKWTETIPAKTMRAFMLAWQPLWAVHY
ncbi:hypothetical protein ACKLNO_05650 [Neisseriaceae bacterium B1]